MKILIKQNAYFECNAKFLGRGNANERTWLFVGLPNHGVFIWLVTPYEDKMMPSKVLNAGTQILIILIKIRLNFLNTDLAYRFRVSFFL